MKTDTYLDICFSKFKEKITDTPEFRKKMREIYIKFYQQNEPTNIKKMKADPLLVIDIKDGQATEEKNNNGDTRIPHIMSLLKKALKWANGEVPDTKLYFWVSDRVPWELGEYMDKYPFYVFAAPKNVNNIIFPDNTFECITLQKKYKGTCFDWDSTKKLFEKKNKEYKHKQKIIYFKGTPTTNKIHRIRELLADYAKTRKNMLILLDGWQNYTPITENSKYMFLLNLPGHYPWSNRFKYLFLTNSVIININVFTKSINEEGWNEDEYHSFIDLIMEPDKDYINLSFTYYNAGISKSIELQNKAQKMTEKEVARVVTQIENIYTNYTPKQYDSMIKNYRRKIADLNNEDIYAYIVKCIKNNSKIILG